MAQALGNLDDEDVDALAAILSPEAGEFFLRSVEQIREGKDKPVGEALAPPLDDYWNKALKQQVEAKLRQFAGVTTAESALRAGQVAFSRGDYARAIEDYNQALRLDPGYAAAYNNRANARCYLGQVEASLDDRLQALRLGAFTPEAAQIFLRDRGFYSGAIDGAFGPVSRKAQHDWTAAGCPGG
jgi:tetratricopeptide (TPR) repeat protein